MCSEICGLSSGLLDGSSSQNPLNPPKLHTESSIQASQTTQEQKSQHQGAVQNIVNQELQSSGPFYQVTFLHKIYRAYLSPNASSNGRSRLSSLLELLLDIFKISSDHISLTILVDIYDKSLITSDEQLLPSPDKFYYLAFSHRPLSVLSQAGSFPLLNCRLHSRRGKGFQISEEQQSALGRVQELRVDRRIGNYLEFECPFLQCGKQFPRSCDLVFHFLVETDARPYKCEHCKQAFRRAVLLNRHLARCKKAQSSISKRIGPALQKYECNLCPRVFGNQNALYLHQNLSHKKQPPLSSFPVERSVLQMKRNQQMLALLSKCERGQVLSSFLQMRVLSEIIQTDCQLRMLSLRSSTYF